MSVKIDGLLFDVRVQLEDIDTAVRESRDKLAIIEDQADKEAAIAEERIAELESEVSGLEARISQMEAQG